jgi:hypothetical protein
MDLRAENMPQNAPTIPDIRVPPKKPFESITRAEAPFFAAAAAALIPAGPPPATNTSVLLCNIGATTPFGFF